MRNKTIVFIIILFFTTMTLGKGVSDQVASPEIDYIMKGNVQSNNGKPVSGVIINFEFSNSDTSYISRSITSTITNDSGLFNVELKAASGFETEVRIVVAANPDTLRTHWISTSAAKQEEVMGTFTTNDCYAKKRTAPVAEIYTFPSQIIILP